jgi:wyosine [tRNA(Phe)-imidazoG37] synthetase (radical SAM superfamily)
LRLKLHADASVPPLDTAVQEVNTLRKSVCRNIQGRRKKSALIAKDGVDGNRPYLKFALINAIRMRTVRGHPGGEVSFLEPAFRPETKKNGLLPAMPGMELAFGYPRNFLDNRYVYVVLSSRARGLSVGLNLSPARTCNFDCVYCEVNRSQPTEAGPLDVEVMAAELQRTLAVIQSGRIRSLPCFAQAPRELLELRHVALSGDGEPTLCPNFAEAVQAVVHLRALGSFPFFKMVLITNATGLELPGVQEGLKFFTKQDEVWAKLDAGTQEYMNRVNRPGVALERVLANILTLARQRPVVIQSLFPAIQGEEPPDTEVDAYAQRLQELKLAGAQISSVQIYSAGRPSANAACGHLPLKSLSRIAHHVKKVTGLPVEVF